MIDRIINMVIRQIVNRAVRGGMNAAIKKGGSMLSDRGKGKQRVAETSQEIEQHPIDTQRRKMHPDDRKGDDVLYPTDEYTDGMQPRR